MIKFFELYDKKYAPNTRETVLRQTIHQFIRHGLVVVNPDKPDRPTNSYKTVYQIDDDALKLVKSFGTDQWTKNLQKYLKVRNIKVKKHLVKRKRRMLSIDIQDTTLLLSPGGQNRIIIKIFEEFVPAFVPNGTPLLVGDTARDSGYCDLAALSKIGMKIPKHGKVPDVVIHDAKNNWLFVMEAVSSHGPIDEKRHDELRRLFSKSSAGIVYVTAFLDRKSMTRHLRTISWATEVWVADSPKHMIHFDGERFLEPYENQ